VAFVSLGIGVLFKAQVIKYTKKIIRFGKRCCKKILRVLGLWKPSGNKYEEGIIYPKLSEIDNSRLKNAIRISFTGDLILLRDMLEKCYDSKVKEYQFDSMFEYTSEYWKSSDLAIGVFEGPVAKDEPYTTSDYYDNLPLYINYPQSFADSVKKAGFNLLTLSNNHLFDRGVKGQEDTLEYLDTIGIKHTGSYRTKEEHDQVCLVTIKGLRIAVLSYTYGCEFSDDSIFVDKNKSYRTDYVLSKNSKFFKENVERVKSDFVRAKAQKPDMIMVLPHMGDQFLHYPDENQKAWCDIFVECGADIIFSDHSHAVQPIEWRRNKNGKTVLLAHCPGNFINSYTEYDGDASMIIEAYVDPTEKSCIAASIIPLYAYGKTKDSPLIALPIHRALTDDKYADTISFSEYRRISEVHRLVTKVALGIELPIDNLQDRYITMAHGGYCRQKVSALEWREDYNKSRLVAKIKQSKKVCFVGDSITDGFKNGGYGWYEPLMGCFPGVETVQFAKGAETSVYFNKCGREIADKNADLYIVAFGCNDIRYRDSSQCAMTASAYLDEIKSLVNIIRNKVPSSEFAFIAPWMSYEPDPYNYAGNNKEQLYKGYIAVLEDYCKEQNFLFIDPCLYIQQRVTDDGMNRNKYFIDHIHPNGRYGINLFSEACIMSSIG